MTPLRCDNCGKYISFKDSFRCWYCERLLGRECASEHFDGGSSLLFVEEAQMEDDGASLRMTTDLPGDLDLEDIRIAGEAVGLLMVDDDHGGWTPFAVVPSEPEESDSSGNDRG